MQLVCLIATGFLAGVIGSILGLGGGIIMVPALTLIFRLPIHEAVGTSLFGVVAVSTAAAIDFLKSGRADIELGLRLGTLTVLGALTGSLLAAMVHTKTIHLLFAIVLLYAGFNMLRRRKEDRDSTGKSFPRNMGLGLAFSFAAGNISGLLGVGGGIAKVPIMNLVMSVPLKTATATSSYMIGMTAATGAVVYLMRGDVDFYKAAAIIPGIFLGSRLGALLSYRLNSFVIRMFFVVVIIYTAIKMISRGL